MLDKLTCIADHGEQQNSWYQAGCTAGLRYGLCRVLHRTDVRLCELAMSFPLFSRFPLPGNRFQNAETDQQSRGKCQQNRPGVERNALKQTMDSDICKYSCVECL